VFAFEPLPANVEILRRNLIANQLDNVTLIPRAVLDRAGTVRLLLSRRRSGNSCVSVPPGEELGTGEQGQSIDVKAITLDEFFSTRDRRPTFVKLDIEGAEMAALAGMRDILSDANLRTLVIEFNPFYLNGSSGSELFQLMLANGFGCAILDDFARQIRRDTPGRVLSFLLALDYTANILWSRDPESSWNRLSAKRESGVSVRASCES
jgi:FkbM family methyltransferase